MDKTARNAQCREPNRKTMQSWKAGYQETGTSGLVGGSQKPGLAIGKGAGSLLNITYIPTDSSRMYVAVVLDLFSRRIVGWAMNNRQDEVLVEQAVAMAVTHCKPAAGRVMKLHTA